MIGVRDTTEEECCRMREEDRLARRQILVMAEVGKGQSHAFGALTSILTVHNAGGPFQSPARR
jgi:hypothetical protein